MSVSTVADTVFQVLPLSLWIQKNIPMSNAKFLNRGKRRKRACKVADTAQRSEELEAAAETTS